MKVYSETLIQTFKPIRIVIDIENPQEITVIRNLLQFAASGGYALDERGQTVVRTLLTVVDRL